MSLSERLLEYVRACFTGLWIHTFEPADALVEIAGLCRVQNWRLATWDLDRGLSVAAGSTHGRLGVRSSDSGNDRLGRCLESGRPQHQPSPHNQHLLR